MFLAAHGADRIEVVDLGQVVHAPAADVGLVDDFLSLGHLHEVEVEILIGHANAVEAVVGRVVALVGGVPGHDERLHGELVAPVGQEFVPHHYVLAVFRLEPCAELFNEPGLQFVHAGETFFLNAAGTVGVCGPLTRGALVAADVQIPVGEHLGYVAEHALEEVDDLVVAHVEHVLRDAAVHAHLVGLRRVAAQFGIGRDGSHHVAGEVNLGDDFNVALLGISHNLAQLVERIEAAAAILRVVVVFGAGFERERGLAHGTDGGQLGIFGDFHAPALVVGQVPVEAVELVDSGHVEQLLDFVHREEVARHVEVETTVTHERFVLDGEAGQCPRGGIAHLRRAVDGSRQKLLQGLYSIEETGIACGGYHHAVIIYNHTVSLRFLRFIEHHVDGTGLGTCTGSLDSERRTRHLLHLGGHRLGQLPGSLVGVRDGGERSHGESAFLLRQGGGIRDEGQRLARGVEVVHAHKLQGLVGIRAVVPQTEFLARSGTAPLVHIHTRVGLGRNDERSAVGGVGSGLELEERVARRVGRGVEHTVTRRGCGVELQTRLARQRVAGGIGAFHLPELRSLARGHGRQHFIALTLRRQHVLAVEELDEIPHLVVRRAHRGHLSSAALPTECGKCHAKE